MILRLSLHLLFRDLHRFTLPHEAFYPVFCDVSPAVPTQHICPPPGHPLLKLGLWPQDADELARGTAAGKARVDSAGRHGPQMSHDTNSTPEGEAEAGLRMLRPRRRGIRLLRGDGEEDEQGAGGGAAVNTGEEEDEDGVGGGSHGEPCFPPSCSSCNLNPLCLLPAPLRLPPPCTCAAVEALGAAEPLGIPLTLTGIVLKSLQSLRGKAKGHLSVYRARRRRWRQVWEPGCRGAAGRDAPSTATLRLWRSRWCAAASR